MKRDELFAAGVVRMRTFCEVNNLPVQRVESSSVWDWGVSACAYWRPDGIHICVPLCAPIGRGGAAWSCPGYVIDRTPYGVIAHEMGHCADWTKSVRKGAYFGDYSANMRALTGEAPITTYAPNDGEWFAEIFRLFITNPDLLLNIRPKTYAMLAQDFKPVEVRPWEEVLNSWHAPDRTIQQARKKIREARKGVVPAKEKPRAPAGNGSARGIATNLELGL